LNLPSPYSFLFVILAVSISSGTAYAANDNDPRVNPFELPQGIYSKDNIPKVKPQDLALQAIFNINGKLIATISGENFLQGDFAFGKRILNISDNKVVLDAAGKEETLVLKKSKFRLKKSFKN
jgi:hypothetical protein